jgi:hypothetical protein
MFKMLININKMNLISLESLFLPIKLLSNKYALKIYKNGKIFIKIKKILKFIKMIIKTKIFKIWRFIQIIKFLNINKWE